jgi:NAD-dependent dihydropyrimidine dehydrogenase PreA subunit
VAKKITVVISQGQSASPEKRKLEEDLVGALLFEQGLEVTVIPHLYDLAADGTGILCLKGITGDMVVLSWLFERGAHWTLDRNGIKGRLGQTLLKSVDIDDEEDEEPAAEDDKPRVGGRDLPTRTIYHLDLRSAKTAQPFIDEIKRIVKEASVETVGLMGWISGTPNPESLERYLNPGASSVSSSTPYALPPTLSAASRIEETPGRRWYPVIDYSRCTNCMECIDFCLFGVYGVDRQETILVEQPDNCRKGCPACSRVCPENAIIFPQHKTPAIAGSPGEGAGGLKIDLSALFGAPSAVELAAQERDVELVAVGRDAVGLSVGIPKRQEGKDQQPKDDLDALMDQLDGAL